MLAIFVILHIAVLLEVSSVECRRHGRIINGAFAKSGEIPYQISLQVNGVHECGGIILNKNFLLTAAHCILNTAPDKIKIIAGTADLENLKNTTSIHEVSNIRMHEEYDQDDSWKNDIALLKVGPPFEFSKCIAPANLALKDDVYEDNKTAVVSGFGRISQSDNQTSSKLMKTNVFVINQKYCEEIHTHYIIRPTNICANNFSEKRGNCKVGIVARTTDT